MRRSKLVSGVVVLTAAMALLGARTGIALGATPATTTTTVTCTPSSFDVNTATTCTAAVSGGSETPEGTVNWSHTGAGSLSAASCNLANGSCSVTYTPTACDSPVVTGAYQGGTESGSSDNDGDSNEGDGDSDEGGDDSYSDEGGDDSDSDEGGDDSDSDEGGDSDSDEGGDDSDSDEGDSDSDEGDGGDQEGDGDSDDGDADSWAASQDSSGALTVNNCEQGGGATLYRPDLLIRKAGHHHFIGEGIIDGSGTHQRVHSFVRKGHTTTAYIKVENDGNVTDTIVVGGRTSQAGFSAKYYLGKKNISRAIAHHGYFLALAAGRDRTIKLVVTAFKTASSGKERTWQVIGRSLNNPLKRDVVKFTTTIR